MLLDGSGSKEEKGARTKSKAKRERSIAPQQGSHIRVYWFCSSLAEEKIGSQIRYLTIHTQLSQLLKCFQKITKAAAES